MTDRYVVTMKSKFVGKLQLGDFFTRTDDGENKILWGEDITEAILSGKPVYQYLLEGKCREFKLRRASDA